MTTLLKLLTVTMTFGWGVWFGTSQIQESNNTQEQTLSEGFVCSSDEVRTKLFEAYPSKKALQESLEKQVYEYMQNKPPAAENPPIYTLPLVVHIIHDNGAENLTDLIVQQGVQHLNDAFENVNYYDQGTGVDVQIAFCLAKQDPDGNPTTGITRDVNTLTVMTLADDIAVKDINRWDPTSYINIWLVREIAGGVAGYAYLPSSHGNPEDGIVMEAEYFGSSESNSAVQVHEMGHYLGLYHTFEGGCDNDDCLADGDRICDTPPDQTTVAAPCEFTQNSCDTDVNLADPNNPFTSDQDDMFINYMDYSNLECYSAFTEGQKDRMQFFVETTRNSLLASIGCEDPCLLPITADFDPDALTIDIGGTLNFTNTSVNGVDYVWRVDGTTFSNAVDTAFQFNQLGTFDITLVATNDAPNCIDSLTISIEVTCRVQASFIQDAFTVNVGEQVNFTNTTTNAFNYEWFVDGVSQGTTTDFSFIFDTPGLYSVYLVAEGLLCSDTTSLTNFIRVGDCAVAVTYAPDTATTCDDIQFMAESECNFSSYYWSYCEPDSLGAPSQRPPAGGLAPVPVGIDFVDNTQNGTGYHIFVTHYQQPVDRIVRMDYGNDLNNPTPNIVNINTPDITGGGPLQLNQGIDIVEDNGEFIGFMVVWNRIYRLNFGSDITNVNPQVTQVEGITGAFEWGVSLDVYQIGANWWGLVTARNTNNIALLYFGENIRGDVQDFFSYDGGNADAEFTGATLIVEDEQFYVLACDIINGLIRFDFGNSLANVPTTTNLGFFGDGFQWTIMVYKECESRYVGFLFKESGDDQKVLEFANGITSTPTIIDDIVIGGRVNSVTPFHRVGDELNFFIIQWDDATVTNFYYENCTNSIPPSSTGQTPNVVYYGDEGFYNVKLIVDEGLPWQQVICTEIFVEDCGIENCFNGRDDDGDGLIDCYDPDCCGDEFCEDFYYVECPIDCSLDSTMGDFELEMEWSTLGGSADWCAYNTPIVADVDRDGIPEVLGKPCTGANQNSGIPLPNIIVVDGETGNIETVIQTPAFTYANDGPGIADLDGNGFPEIFMQAGNLQQNATYLGGPIINGDVRRRIVCYEFDGTSYNEKWLSNAPAGYQAVEDSAPVSAADFNGDGVAELYVGNQIFNGATGELIVEAGSTSPRGILPDAGFLNWAVQYSVAANVLPDGFCTNCTGLELVAGNAVYSVNIDPTNPSLSTLNIEVELTNGLDGRTSLADFDNDGDLDALVTTNDGTSASVYVWDLQTPNFVVNTFQLLGFSNDVSHANIGDFDGDGEVETGICTVGNYQVLKRQGNTFNILWSIQTTDNSGQTASTVFDFNNDGKFEVAYRDEENIRIFDGGTGTLIASDPCTSGTRVEYPVVVDVDADGETELVCSCANEVRAYGSVSTPWVSTRQVWNQHTYFNVNINDDLSVPTMQQEHHIVGDSIVLNNFLTQYADPQFPAPDATITVDEFGCGLDSFQVTLTICNNGDLRLTGETPITFYDANPTTTNANVMTTQEIGVNIDPDGCATIQLYLPSLYDTPIFVVVNDDASILTPFDLANDFPSSSVAECDYGNNLDSLLLEGPPPPELDLGPDQLICDNAVLELNAGSGFVSYEWYDGTTDSIVTVWLEGEYWVEVIDSCGQTQRDTIEIITDFPTIAMVEPQTATICPGQSVEFCVQEEFFEFYQWQDSPSLSCTDCRCVTATPDEPGSYIVQAWTASGCYSVDTVEVFFANISTDDELTVCPGASAVIHGQTVSIPGTYSQTFTLSDGCDSTSNVTLNNYLSMIIFDNTTPSCELGTNGSLSVNVINGTHPLTYEWDIPGVGDTSAISNLPPSTYNVTVTDANGCTQIQDVLVPVGNPIVIDFDPTPTCEGGNQGAIVANVTGAQDPVTYDWDIPGAGNVPAVTNLMPGTYNLTVTDGNGCTLEQSVEVETVDDPTIALIPTPPSCPDGNDGTLEVGNANPAWMYSLDGVNFQSSPIFTNLTPGDYTVFITDGPCNYEGEGTIPNTQAPDISTQSTPPTCPAPDDDDGQITIDNPEPGWTFSINGGPFQSQPFFTGLAEGDYTITVMDGDCEYQVTESVGSAPPVGVDIVCVPDCSGSIGDTIMLIADIEPNTLSVDSYNWTPTENLFCDNNNCDTAFVIITDIDSIVYDVVITTEDGCTAEDRQDIQIVFQCNPDNIRFPNAFTPDSDGMNDIFELVPNEESDARVISLDIYNRWGQLVYESGTNGDMFWDGNHDGDPAPSDVYVYVAKYICGDEEEVRFGDITLLR